VAVENPHKVVSVETAVTRIVRLYTHVVKKPVEAG
jgi:hypothetical protein